MSTSKDIHVSRSGWRILLAGTGGQGVVTAAKFLSEFFVQRGHYVTSAQLHGMAQRGGAVQSSVLVDSGISPALPLGGADFVLGFEPVETVRALPYMSARTVVFMNTSPVVPFVLAQQHALGEDSADYPELSRLVENIRIIGPTLYTLDATEAAKNAGSIKTVNVVMLGCLFGAGLLPYSDEDFVDTIVGRAPARLKQTNGTAFASGVEFGKSVSSLEVKS